MWSYHLIHFGTAVLFSKWLIIGKESERYLSATWLTQRQDQLSRSSVIMMWNWRRAVRSKLCLSHPFRFSAVATTLLAGKRTEACFMLSRQWKVLSPCMDCLNTLTHLKVALQLTLSTQIQNSFSIRWEWKGIVAVKC